MKKYFLFSIAILIVSAIFAQLPVKQTYVVRFKDKGANTDAAINPSSYLSAKAVERRLKQKIAFDESDLPVNQLYIEKLTESGAKILTISRWFNWAVVEATAEASVGFSKFPFVLSLEMLDKSNSKPFSGKPFFLSENVEPWAGNIFKKTNTDLYDYGIAFNQINQLNGQFLHNQGFSGQGMTIAVIDAGFNSVDIMTCFDSLRANNQILGTRDFVLPGNNVYGLDMHSHGTSVLSTMGAYAGGQMVGTAPKADYWLLRSEDGGSEKIIEEYYWVSAAEFADSVGADLINSSLGYTTFDDPSTNHTYADMDGNTTVVTKGADKAAEKGILVVNSAGNSGGGGWWYIGAPADGDSVFSIGAVDASGIRAGFSSVGPTFDGRIKPTVAAQGQGTAVYSPWGLGNGSGTSFSSPVTCGMTACFWQSKPDLNNMEVIEAIKATASQAYQPDSLLGWGIPNYQAAFTSLSAHFQAIEKTLIAFPNPFKDDFTIGFPAPVSGKYCLEIVNLQGKIVYNRRGYGNAINSLFLNNFGSFVSGIYLVRVWTETSTYSVKIIKK